MRAVKGNKEYIIDESQQKGYQDIGFDIMDDDGKTIAYGRGKTVSYNEHMKAVKEIGRLRDRIAEIESAKVEIEKEPEKKVANRKAGE